MKRVLSTFMTMVILITLTACGTSEKSAVIPQEEYNTLNDKYLLYGTILAYTWSDAEELMPDFFPTYYALYFLHNGGTSSAEWENAMYMPQEDVEAMVQSHFDVSIDFLRSGSDYRPEKEAYEFYGIGSAAYTQVTSAEQNGTLLTIHYDMLNPVDELIAQGSVVIEVNGENYKYVSNTTTQDPHNTGV